MGRPLSKGLRRNLCVVAFLALTPQVARRLRSRSGLGGIAIGASLVATLALGFLRSTGECGGNLASLAGHFSSIALRGLVRSGRTPERREVIHYIRAYFEKNESVPEARTLFKHMRSIWGEDKATRRYLYQLFPRGYGQQACKIAGMRKPRKLMLDV